MSARSDRQSGRDRTAERPFPPCRRVLRVRDVQEAVGCSKPFVLNLVKTGKLRASKLDGLLLIEPDSFESWLASRIPVEPGGVR
ncbi:MAG: helix-turn-helix domain-containing protein [Planctomycetota bacterium]